MASIKEVPIFVFSKIVGRTFAHRVETVSLAELGGSEEVDATKLKKELGWEPTLQFEEEIEKTVKWYLENEEWLKNVTSGEYRKYYEEMYG